METAPLRTVALISPSDYAHMKRGLDLLRNWCARLAGYSKLIILGAAIFSVVDSFGQCSVDNIVLTFPDGTCNNFPAVLVYANGDAEYFTLYKQVNGTWQQVSTAPNDAPPIQFNLTVSQTTIYGISYTYNGCETSLKGFTMNPVPAAPSVTGTTQVCSGQSAALTANGTGSSYRWYDGATLISGETGPALDPGPLTSQKTYNVSTVSDAGCESLKASITVTVDNLPSVTGFSISPGTEFYGVVSPTLTLSNISHTGTLTYESSPNGTTWSATSASLTVSQPVTYFHAKAVNGVCPPVYSNTLTVSLYPAPVITIAEAVNYVSHKNTLHLSVPTYASIQWKKDGQAMAGANTTALTVFEPGIYAVSVKGSSTAPEATGSTTIYSNVVQSQNLNYISTVTFQKENSNPPALENLAAENYAQSTTYYDGLGRPIQSVVTQGSPSGLDIVQPMVYDPFGREVRKYLPFTSQTNGWYKPNGDIINAATGDYKGIAVGFYDGAPGKIAVDNRPFAETTFERSPLARVLKQGTPGEVWQPNTDSAYTSTDRTVKRSYETNGENEVLRWTYSYPVSDYSPGLVNAGTSGAPAYYSDEELYKNRTKDEQRHEVIEYTDKEGRIVLKRVQAVEGTPAIDDSNFASTYYIYDDLGELVCVIQPEGVKNITQYLNADATGKEDFLKKWAFRYRYDGRRRMITKQVPGAAPVYMIYDNRDRLVLSQDGERRTASQWLFTKYDVLNRPVLTGITVIAGEPSVVQSNVNSFYTTLPNGAARFESYSVGGAHYGYDNKSYPQIGSVADYRTVMYYDKYDATIAPSGYGPASQQLPGEIVGNQNTIYGQVTGTLVRNLETNAWMRTVNYYDDKLRLIQTIGDHHKGTVRVSNVYDFPGRILFSQRKYVVSLGASTETTTIRESFTYDHTGRLLVTKHSLNGAPDVVISANYYNELGQLVAKGLHHTGYPPVDDQIGQPGVTHEANIERSTPAISGTKLIATNSVRLKPGFKGNYGVIFGSKIGFTPDEAQATALPVFQQVIDYAYNIRGWLTSINDPSTPGTDLFNMSLRYNDPTANGGVAQFNGNISEAIWKTTGFDNQSYGYSYDPMNRLLKGQYFSQAIPLNNGRYNEEIGVDSNRPAYDLNGNILNLKRYGKMSSTTYGLMDNLHYQYANGGNQLTAVQDDIATNAEEQGFKEVETASDYTYDDNGNLEKDENKEISAIGYNYLNLPAIVNKSANDYMIYTYDATGKKLAQQVYGSTPKTTDYIGELVYENNVLQFVNHSEGRVVVKGGADYQYHLKDHLGNVRLTFATKVEATTETASFEQANVATEQSQFVRYANARRVQSHLLDRTNGAAPSTTPGYAQRLSGGANERYGLAKSISVMPGDKIKAEVWAKYVDPQNANWSAALQALMTQVVAGSNGTTVLDGGSYSSATSSFPFATQGTQNTENSSEPGPKAYLNWLVFDKDYNFKLAKSGFDRLSSIPKEQGQDVAHEPLFSPEIVIDEPGYVYIYLSNEEGTPLEVYFDDFKVEHVRGNIVQVDDYYPFGLTFNSFQRGNSVDQKFKFQGQEHIDALDLGWDSFKWRNHQSDIGRFFNIDPLADKYVYNSPYAFSENKVIAHRELEGLESEPINQQSLSSVNVTPVWNKNGTLDHYDVTFTLTQTESHQAFDANNVAIEEVTTTTTSVHTISMDNNLAPRDIPQGTPKFYQNNPFLIKNLTVKSAMGKVVTTTTPISTNRENAKSTTKTELKQTGTVTLSQSTSKQIKSAVQKNKASVLQKWFHMMMGSETKKNNKLKNGAPHR